MAIQLVNLGNTANDGTGDDLREAFVKVNANFNELDLRDDEQTTVSNLGATGEGLYKEKVNYDLRIQHNIELQGFLQDFLNDLSMPDPIF